MCLRLEAITPGVVLPLRASPLPLLPLYAPLCQPLPTAVTALSGLTAEETVLSKTW